MKTQRPKNLDLRTIQLPLPGVVSILHRVSGVILFLTGIPLFLYFLERGLHPERAGELGVFPRLVLAPLIWAFLHHFCAGIRFLLLDIHLGLDKAQARRSSLWVLGVSGFLTLIVELLAW
ncbi:succinate dehydrogenase, cytochrome b556 subunit [Ferrovum myxofaciens]|jgi:succinate dehydrogenase / fumarate reductase cytochrome b subunit|uniref:Succinate dehydrogenase cytochrome b556 subunit n=2 Tax=root TaxID=1 RepID=A0A859A6V3_9PROT|nr:succinate dehydrogenase, cytochrome b556 subunit [Ferrovum myxofaciens]MBW8028736.1 succinate dehydrogenase, cytochrome b556 subunit [Ferrovum sp.]KXW58969.1 succinate dehydrogenase cytochrome b556 subunit [Ferrovum myxofaciens]MBU6993863.1 succinate dehydrogenase, cytochrome b556 subunit [Ferrovum myxofaciens]QKE37751.1 MAG: succinate dehydrogenase, cytochrome b556 subunit [Ferrovum myxofaciens]QKE40230.1 MAG: succinate dehydrogenase, cytochrome b556 subunit [Ferrovum myxofaciens]